MIYNESSKGCVSILYTKMISDKMISNKMITDSQDKNLTPALSSREGERGRRIASGRINIETDDGRKA